MFAVATISSILYVPLSLICICMICVFFCVFWCMPLCILCVYGPSAWNKTDDYYYFILRLQTTKVDLMRVRCWYIVALASVGLESSLRSTTLWAKPNKTTASTSIGLCIYTTYLPISFHAYTYIQRATSCGRPNRPYIYQILKIYDSEGKYVATQLRCGEIFTSHFCKHFRHCASERIFIID